MSHRRHDVLLANQAVPASQQRSHYHWSVRLRQLSSAMFASFKKLFFILQQNWGDIYLFEMWRPLAACQILAAFCWHLDTFWWLLTRQRWRRRWYDVDNKAEEEDDCKQEKAEDEVDKMTRWQDDKMTRWQGCPHFSLLESHVSQVGESWNNGYIAHLVWTADHQAICNFFLISKNSIDSTLHSRTDRSAAGHWTLSSTLLSMIFNVLPATFLPRQMGSVGRRCD